MSIGKYYNEILGATTPRMNEEIDAKKTVFESQRNTVKDDYNALIADTNTDYYDEANRNAIQKLVNEKKIAENMENLGLTDSGLNRTQQTAVQLSYSNNQAKLERQRQKAVDALNLELTGKLAEINTNESDAINAIEDKYHQSALSTAQEQYNAELEAATELAKAQIEASAKSSSSNSGSTGTSKLLLTFTGQQKVDGNNNTINIYTGNDGKTYYAKKGYNPYKNENNTVAGNGNKKFSQVQNKTLSDSQKAAAVYGTTSNGYQPKGVVYNGTNYGPLGEIADTLPNGNEITGKSQNVWKTELYGQGVHFWVWYGTENTYVEVVQQNGEWKVI